MNQTTIELVELHLQASITEEAALLTRSERAHADAAELDEKLRNCRERMAKLQATLVDAGVAP